MMRILLGSGEEAVYRTVDELALGISSGTVTASARFFDSPSQGWRAIDAHPEYQAALARAANFGPGIDLVPPPSGAAPVIPEIQLERASGTFQIYQMFSLSAAELQAKKRPAWLLPAIAGVAALALAISLWVAIGGKRPLHEVAEEVTSLAATTTVPVADTRLPVPSSVAAMRLAPMNLNSHLTFALEAAGRRLSDSAEALGAKGLLTRGRLLSADSVRHTRDLLVTLRTMIANYRAVQRRTQDAYRDTAAMLVKSGFWSKIDQQEWKVYPSASESPLDVARADSLLNQLEALYDLLEEQPHGYREVDGRIQFDDQASGQQYERLRSQLSRHDQPDLSLRTTALAVLRRATSGPRPSGYVSVP